MSVSVDGFIAGPQDGPEHGLGVDGERLHAWLGAGGEAPESYRPAGGGPDGEVFDGVRARPRGTGAAAIAPRQ